jgi:hypothetical protein
MTRRHPLTILTASMALGVATTVLLSGCAGDDTPDRTPSASRSSSASPTPSATPTTAPAPTPEPTTDPTDEQTGAADDGTGPGTGNGSGVEAPENVDFASIAKQGVAAAGDGTVVSLTGSGDNWTVVVAGPDGSLTQAVVSATLGRVTSGPFPKDSDQATKTADAARAAAIRVDAPAAATTAAAAVQGTVTSVVLGGSGSAPTWTVGLTVGGAARTVTVDGISGATS